MLQSLVKRTGSNHQTPGPNLRAVDTHHYVPVTMTPQGRYPASWSAWRTEAESPSNWPEAMRLVNDRQNWNARHLAPSPVRLTHLLYVHEEA